ncbi:Clavaminate synthase-like protein [Mollisia scopiformis]|uniref:Clavaminate synthase-like protein n=1 Tax=Mollisia scopiformis TaxID=149040 RepID=A0A132B931_MOLSC|nr:Clavaminate synthase-like protein [Mollisia scopiformis]KUJ08384.1 Clavaminate synthase-like protein [Mollisia scopiformis]
MNLFYVKVGQKSWHPAFLRDACTCPLCVDPSSKQKNFQTTDIPKEIEAKSVKEKSNGDVTITWTKDVPGFKSSHVTTIPATFFATYNSRASLEKARYLSPAFTWTKQKITERLQFIDFHEYMHDEARLRHALRFLTAFGILLVRGVPDNENAVEDLTSRIGTLRDTFYGRTWDVKSIPDAKNVAYTQQHLGLHMDLLYMQNPPGLQFLHCLKNTAPGGNSLFSDALSAAHSLPDPIFETLSSQNIAFEYRNDGQHYYLERPVLEVGNRQQRTVDFYRTKYYRPEVLNINWSPPFQATLPFPTKIQGHPLPNVLRALRHFAKKVQHPAAIYEYRLNEGECIIFNNRRILHGRTAFDATQGERWLKGAYVDNDVFQSRHRVLCEQAENEVDFDNIDSYTYHVHPEEARMAQEKQQAYTLKMEESDD